MKYLLAITASLSLAQNTLNFPQPHVHYAYISMDLNDFPGICSEFHTGKEPSVFCLLHSPQCLGPEKVHTMQWLHVALKSLNLYRGEGVFNFIKIDGQPR